MKITLEIIDNIQNTTMFEEDFTSFGTLQNAIDNVDTNELYQDVAHGASYQMVQYDDDGDVVASELIEILSTEQEYKACVRCMEILCPTYTDKDIAQATQNAFNNDELTTNLSNDGRLAAWYLSQDGEEELAVWVDTLKQLTPEELKELEDANGCGY